MSRGPRNDVLRKGRGLLGRWVNGAASWWQWGQGEDQAGIVAERKKTGNVHRKVTRSGHTRKIRKGLEVVWVGGGTGATVT